MNCSLTKCHREMGYIKKDLEYTKEFKDTVSGVLKTMEKHNLN